MKINYEKYYEDYLDGKEEKVGLKKMKLKAKKPHTKDPGYRKQKRVKKEDQIDEYDY